MFQLKENLNSIWGWALKCVWGHENQMIYLLKLNTDPHRKFVPLLEHSWRKLFLIILTGWFFFTTYNCMKITENTQPALRQENWEFFFVQKLRFFKFLDATKFLFCPQLSHPIRYDLAQEFYIQIFGGSLVSIKSEKP